MTEIQYNPEWSYTGVLYLHKYIHTYKQLPFLTLRLRKHVGDPRSFKFSSLIDVSKQILHKKVAMAM